MFAHIHNTTLPVRSEDATDPIVVDFNFVDQHKRAVTFSERIPAELGVSPGFQSFQILQRFAPSWLISFAAHGLLLCVIALITIDQPKRNEVMVEASTLDLEEIEIEKSPTFHLSNSSSVSRQAEKELTTANLPANASLLAQTRWNAATKPVQLESFVSTNSGGQIANLIADIEAEFNAAVDPGSGFGEGQNDVLQADFFGIETRGKRFVFVIDSSTSMRGKKWVRACRELWQTLAELSDDQEFCILFFDLKTHLMFRRKPGELETIAATAENVKRVKRWASTVHLGPETLPMTALHCAIDLDPDAIFLLSDGEFHDRSQFFLFDQNGSRGKEEAVPVNTVAFTSEVGGQALKEIANENFGQFRFVK